MIEIYEFYNSQECLNLHEVIKKLVSNKNIRLIATIKKLNQLNKQVEGVVDNVKQYYNFNPEELSQINQQIEKIKKLSIELGSLKNKKDDDNTITYF